MPPKANKRAGPRSRVIFPGRAVVASILQAQRRPSSSSDTMSSISIPDLFRSEPPIKDHLETATSTLQADTVQACLPYLTAEVPDAHNQHGLPHVYRAKHAAFLRKQLAGLPAQFVAADASRPWWLYWGLNGLRLLGYDVSSYRESLRETARSMQNATGGFGGGNGQLSHLATTYAVVLALALVGGQDLYEVVDRRALWRWLCTLKQPNGGFQMATGGEVDVRGAYCAAVIVSLLNLPLNLTPESPAWAPDGPTLYTKLANYVQRCQTYEGGISAHPDAEAHGAYAFCALGCLAILDSPDRSIPRYLDVPRLISWLSSRQYAPEGGFCGRTNKLVDGCYSHWVGGCWPLIEAALSGSGVPPQQPVRKEKLPAPQQSLYSREGLIRYTMCCCQDRSKHGGLRDKPGKSSDAYHTCYVLSGLSCAQHKWELAAAVPGGAGATPTTTTAAAAAAAGEEANNVEAPPAPVFDAASWTVSPCLDEVQVFDEQDRLVPLHPVYAIPSECVSNIKAYFDAKQGF